jgi:hypothetical protein
MAADANQKLHLNFLMQQATGRANKFSGLFNKVRPFRHEF